MHAGRDTTSPALALTLTSGLILLGIRSFGRGNHDAGLAAVIAGVAGFAVVLSAVLWRRGLTVNRPGGRVAGAAPGRG